MTNYDFMIIGGGPAGAVLAHGLASSKQSVLLLEGDNFTKPRVGETLAAHIQPELQQLGWWQDFLQLNPKPCHGIESTWNKREASFRSNVLNPLGNSWHVNRTAFDALLYNKVLAQHQVTAYSNARITQLQQQSDDSWQVSWRSPKGEQTAQAAIYIDATGRKSLAKNKEKISYQTFDQLVGVGLILEAIPSASLLRHLVIQACPQGWWYAAPLQHNRSVLFLMTDVDIIKAQQLTNMDHWKAAMPPEKALFKAFKDLIPTHKKLLIKQAHSQVVQAVHINQFFTVGDALASFDPITGLGVTRAIQTARGLARWLPHHKQLNPTVCQTFLEQIQPLFRSYLQQWQHTYSTVTQWQEEQFWKRRQKTPLL